MRCRRQRRHVPSHARYCYDTTDVFKDELLARLLRSMI